ncbi:dCTP deaminase domain-containing protein [Actinoalloteichus sp. GBA129-24]|uniref:dCTP deaminase n=1 Tax=Actinoalloteichus sp. GBA129-24 TaxID=1612551 RepID=UPI0009504480|nr:deoxycytidine deaminase [Actinoalloteichus sp. GBA129-24]APU21280.1 deoxycytidine deaminase [Actinoalloteichus sp. GBA129-24]
MILTGPFIEQELAAGRIVIDPFNPDAVNPNSYNYRLGAHIKRFDMDSGTFESVSLPEDGHVLVPRQTYLGHTTEVIGSQTYAMSLIGRSSMGRLGLFLQVSADLGHTTSCHRWTLEIVAARRIRLYPGMVVGQVSFWCNTGQLVPTTPLYATFNDPSESRIGAPT